MNATNIDTSTLTSSKSVQDKLPKEMTRSEIFDEISRLSILLDNLHKTIKLVESNNNASHYLIGELNLYQATQYARLRELRKYIVNTAKV